MTDEGVRREVQLDVPLGRAMERPFEERTLDIYMKFGEAQIQARVVNTTTDTEHKGKFLFESDL